MRLLLVEDHAKAAAGLSDLLASAGHDVRCVASARQGGSEARRGGYDALVLDYVLKDGDGIALLRALRGSGVLTPAVIVSAVGDADYEELRPRAAALAAPVVRKPIDEAELFRLLDSLGG